MWIELTNSWIALINIIGIPTCHLGIAWLCTRLPASLFEKPHHQDSHHDRGPDSVIYEKLFLVRYWKSLLPDAAPWFNGFAKGPLSSTKIDYLQSFVTETRRGEFSHWLQMLAISLFIIWTPHPWLFIILIYAILSNAPCIINLRYTRLRILSLIDKKQSKNHGH